MQGKKTHEQQLRILERKDDVPDQRQHNDAGQSGHKPPRPMPAQEKH